MSIKAFRRWVCLSRLPDEVFGSRVAMAAMRLAFRARWDNALRAETRSRRACSAAEVAVAAGGPSEAGAAEADGGPVGARMGMIGVSGREER